MGLIYDPIKFQEEFWPDITIYKEQREICHSVWYDDETVVPAGHMLGKDFIAGLIIVIFFLTRDPCRVVTTSVDSKQLEGVLWGEMRRFIYTSKYPLLHTKGGPLLYNHLHIRKYVDREDGTKELDALSYIIGRVAEKGEGMSGHHIAQTGDGLPRTLGCCDEACHDDQTEILTNCGWKFFEDLDGKEEFLTMNPETRIGEFRLATRLHRSHRKGEMYRYKVRSADFCVTPNHKMLWKKYWPRRRTWSPYILEEIEEITSQGRMSPRTFRWKGRNQENYALPDGRSVGMKLWLEFLGWYMSEGCVCKSGDRLGSICIYQKDEETTEHIRILIKGLGFNPGVYRRDSEHKGKATWCHAIRFSNKGLAHLLRSYGARSWEKKIPQFVQELTPNLIEVFLHSFKLGDGYDKGDKEVFYTSSRGMADDLQILSLKTGRLSTITVRNHQGKRVPNGIRRRPCYAITRTRKGMDSHVRVKKTKIEKFEYDGMVYCVTVPPYNTIFTRRNGVCIWSGNSGIDTLTFEKIDEWANRKLIIGNPYDCSNYFHQSVEGKPGTKDKGGNILRSSEESEETDTTTGIAKCDIREGGSGYHRRVIKIRAEDSPNVRLGIAQKRLGEKPTNEIIIDGVLPYTEYMARRVKWDPIKQTVGLDAEFYKGSENLMFPPLWLDNSERVSDILNITTRSKGKAMGIDPAEGGDSSSWSVIDDDGLIFLHSQKTPDTAIVNVKTIELMHRFNIPHHRVVFDRGGGGKQHADQLRAVGYKVKTIHFGEGATHPKKMGKKTLKQVIDEQEGRTVYKNRRAEMYATLRQIIDPTRGGVPEDSRQSKLDIMNPDRDKVFALPREFFIIRQQLGPIPLEYDGEGVLVMPPKNKRNKEDTRVTMTEMLGMSPDEADSLVLAVHVLKGKQFKNQPRSMV